MVTALVRSVAVEVVCVVVGGLLGVATVDEQDTVGVLVPVLSG